MQLQIGGKLVNNMKTTKVFKHRQLCCEICKKKMRSDNIKRHLKNHIKRKQQLDNIEFNLNEINNAEISNGTDADLKDTTSENSLEDILLVDNEAYKEKIDLGKQICTILEKGVVNEESLTRDRKFALDLYRKQKPRLDIVDVELRPWQEEALKLIDNPSERKVIWITGRQGNEGKSWFQCYTESYFGFHRVA